MGRKGAVKLGIISIMGSGSAAGVISKRYAREPVLVSPTQHTEENKGKGRCHADKIKQGPAS